MEKEEVGGGGRRGRRGRGGGEKRGREEGEGGREDGGTGEKFECSDI